MTKEDVRLCEKILRICPEYFSGSIEFMIQDDCVLVWSAKGKFGSFNNLSVARYFEGLWTCYIFIQEDEDKRKCVMKIF